MARMAGDMTRCWECNGTGFGPPLPKSEPVVAAPERHYWPLAIPDPADPTGRSLAIPDLPPELPYTLVLREFGPERTIIRPTKKFLTGPAYHVYKDTEATQEELAFFQAVAWYKREVERLKASPAAAEELVALRAEVERLRLENETLLTLVPPPEATPQTAAA
jgi:hypothetical protein